MITKKDIARFLEQSGITSSDTVLVHTSLRSVGGIDGGADSMLDAFCEYLRDGLFIVPTHTWDDVTKDNPFFDVMNSKPCIGVLPCIAAERTNHGCGVRSLHPTHSVAAFGSRAEEYVKGEENSATPAPVGGCWARLYNENAKILLIGVGHDKNTYFHAVDELLGIKNRLSEDAFAITIKDSSGRKHISPPFHTHFTKGAPCCCSEFYPNYKKPLEELGAVTYSRIGDAKVYICDAVKCTEVIRRLWDKADHDICVSEEEIPQNYYLKGGK